MPDLTTAAIAALEAKGLSIAVASRTATSLKCALGAVAKRERFALDCSIGALHYLKDGVYRPINTDWAVGGDGWSDSNETSQARILAKADGTRRIYPDQSSDAYIEFAAPEYWDGEKWRPLEVPEAQSAKAVSAEVAKWAADHWRIEVVNTGSQSKLSYVMLDERAPSRVRWPYTCYACSLDDAGNLTDAKGAVIATVYQGRAEDADGAEMAVKTLFDRETIEYQVDAGKATYPVTLDPTVDYQVGAGANDSRVINYTTKGTGGTFSASATPLTLGCGAASSNKYASFVLFTGVTIPVGATIDTAYLTFRSPSAMSGTTSKTAISGNDTGTPAAPTSAAEAWALVETTATVAWTVPAFTSGSDYNTADIKTIVQELVNSYNYSGGLSMQFMLHENGGDVNTGRQITAYETSTSNCAKLHIEYTEAAGGIAIPVIARQSRQRWA